MPRLLEQSTPLLKPSKDEQLEQERMKNVHLLLEHLIKNEQTTVSMILDCLYDLGAVNLLNQKIRYRPANQVGRWIASLSKPVFKLVAMRWINRNCPQLATEWLHSKVSFKSPLPPEVNQASTLSAETKSILLVEADRYHRDVHQLQTQVRQLRGLLITAIAILGGTTLWLGYERLPQTLQISQFTEFPTLKTSQ